MRSIDKKIAPLSAGATEKNNLHNMIYWHRISFLIENQNTVKHKMHHSTFSKRCSEIGFFLISLSVLTSCGGGSGVPFAGMGDVSGNNEPANGGTAVSALGGDVSGGASGDEPANGAGAVSSPGGTLILTMDGANPGVDHDVLEVFGKAQLGGSLVINFGADFTPVIGQRFTIIKAAGGLSGGFISITNNKDLRLTASQDATNFFVTVGS